ncbi:MAG TPA: type I DNA topoisomerase [Acidimicrobiia bacterium]|nr:type I DNA topoisomerase [Acidimicrobiia bacterium]
MKLVIVESPAKARTIARYLGDDVAVEASMGHIRDLAAKKDLPAEHQDKYWAQFGVDIESGFVPYYVIHPAKKAQVKKLRDALKKADELYLATDEDREGESIAWHLTEVLKPKTAPKRMVFHEITEGAIRAAFDNPRAIDQQLVDAQEARRILDKLYGYEVSPVLWRRVRTGLSAGRVQSVAVRMVVERERERMSFVSGSYWDLLGTFATDAEQIHFPATLVAIDGVRVANGSDFGSNGQLQSDGVVLVDEAVARSLATELEGADFAVRSVESKPYRRSPYPPFRTSTLQQEAQRKLRFSASRTMRIAQRLYEAGYITYMRTDSTALSESAVAAARSQIGSLFGSEYLPAKPRTYTNKVKNAQEAHEAIRPAGDRFRTPAQVEREVSEDEARVYELIWKRTVASQMKDALGESMAVRLGAVSSAGRDGEFAASGRTITFPGFLRAYVEGSDDPEAALDDQETPLPPLEEGDPLTVVELEATGHSTKPPARFTEASLVRQLEEMGVGRPSTYASILETIQERGYIWKRGQSLIPTFTALAVVTLLEQNFEDLVDYAFTARMEDDLDRIAEGEEETAPWLSRFYLGPEGLRQQVVDRLESIDAREVNSMPLGSDDQDREIVVRVGRYGPYIQRLDDRASIPDNLPPDELTIEKAIELLEEQPSGEKILGTDPESGLTVIAKSGRFGPYVQLGEGTSKDKPKTASLFQSMSLDSISLEQALQLLTLPRLVGIDPETGEEVMALNGRYGPFLSRGAENRSLQNEEQLFTVDLPEALALFSQPPSRRGRGPQGGASGREVGVTSDGRTISVRRGRYGPYVTDGEVNASLRAGDDEEKVDLARALELLAARRDRLASEDGSPPRKGGAKKSAKKASPTKKSGTRKNTRKAVTASKKKTAKKT